MKSAVLLSALIAGFAATMFAPTADAQTRKGRPLAVDVYKKPYRGGYSVRKSDTYDTRKFVDQSNYRQSQGGPFDEGFFFETPRGAFGGSAPYFH